MDQFKRLIITFLFLWIILNPSLSSAQNINIKDVTPKDVCIGQTVTISGNNLDRVNRVRFNNVLLELSDQEFKIEDKSTITFPAPLEAMTSGVQRVSTMVYSANFGILPADVFNQNMSVNTLPSPPSNPSGSSYCENGPVSTVSVNNPGAGFRIDWYSQASGGTLLGSGISFQPNGAGTYFAEKVNINTGCSSPTRVSATITLLPSPGAPSGPTGSEYCQGDPVSSISVNNPGSGFRIDWYDAASGGNLLGSGTSFTPSGPGTYYAETFNTTTLCTSLERTAVTVKRNPLPPVPSEATSSTYCSGDPVSSVSVKNPGSGFRIEWYDKASGGNLLGTGNTYTPSAPGTFYAENINTTTGCRSKSRASASVTRSTPPAAPSGPKSSSYCNGDPISSVSVNNPGSGFRIDWYDAASGGNLLGSGAIFTPGGAGTYYAETVNLNSSCRSDSRVSATVKENPAPPAPSGGTGSTYCEGDSPGAVSVNNPGNGIRIDWYGDPSGGSRLASGTSFTPSNPGTYYAESVNINTSCTSLTRTAVKVTRYPSPPAAKNPVNAAFCPAEDIPSIRVDNPGAGFTVTWYKNQTGGALAEGRTSGNNGEVFTPSNKVAATYYAEVSNDESGCVSSKRTAVKIEIDQQNCSNTDFLTFSFDGQASPAKINKNNHTIEAEVPYGTSLNNLVAKFSLPSGAVARVDGTRQESGVTANDFRDPVNYTVTAADGETSQEWKVTVSVLPNSATGFLSFNFLEQSKPTQINRSNKTIIIEVPFGTDLSNLVANFSLPAGAVATVNGVEQVSGETINDFSNTVTYVVTAQDGVTREDWKVRVTEKELIDNEPPDVNAVALPDEYPAGSDSILASITVNDDVKVKKVVVRYRKYQETEWIEEEIPVENSIYSFSITREKVGEHGMFYYFKAYDLANKTDTTAMANMIIRFDDTNSPVIPGLKFGAEGGDYQIISIPLILGNPAVENVFNELLPYDRKQWRLFHYSDSITYEYNEGFNSIEPGKGYWLIVRDPVEINTGGGTTPRMDNVNGLAIKLNPGWNQVGNPYAFNISWDNVLEFNKNQAINRIKLFSNGILTEVDSLAAFQGGFVFSAWDQPVTLRLPPNLDYSNDRIAGGNEGASQPDKDGLEWFLPLTVTNGKYTNALGGIGMHPQSLSGFDRYDEPLLPMPHEISGFEMFFNHPGEKYEKISKDIVRSGEFYTWEFEINKYGGPGNMSLQWENIGLDKEGYGLILADLTGKSIIDMSKENGYDFQASRVHRFKIYFGPDDKLSAKVVPVRLSVGDVYPNPFNDRLNIPLTLPDGKESYNISVSLTDLQGRTFHKLMPVELTAGTHEILCDLQGVMTESRGFYVVRIQIATENYEEIIYRKVLKH